jgi:hypothetical protein
MTDAKEATPTAARTRRRHTGLVRSAVVWIALLTMVGAGPAHAQEPKAMNEKEVAATGGVRLTGQQIAATFTGNTVAAIKLAAGPAFAKGAVVHIYYRDARTRVVTGGRTIESTWWTDGDLSCAENKVERTGHVCGSVYKLGRDFYYCERHTPTCEWYLRLVPGNPHNL